MNNKKYIVSDSNFNNDILVEDSLTVIQIYNTRKDAQFVADYLNKQNEHNVTYLVHEATTKEIDDFNSYLKEQEELMS